MSQYNKVFAVRLPDHIHEIIKENKEKSGMSYQNFMEHLINTFFFNLKYNDNHKLNAFEQLLKENQYVKR